jgi:NhaP-type Na+/H+ or K+/H+ antiporter
MRSKYFQKIAPQILQLAVVVFVASVGLIIAIGGNIRGFEHSPAYLYIATGLLCFGLYMAGYGIDLREARRHWRIVAIAITIGVLAKYVIIAGTAYLLTGDWRYVVVGMAVAQIDPLSVAALTNSNRMSARTRTVLTMWASFDDPMTALATPVLLGIAVQVGHQKLATGESIGGMLVDVVPFVLLVLVMAGAMLWRRFGRKGQKAAMIGIRAQIRDELKEYQGEGPKTALTQAVIILSTAFKNPPTPALFSLVCRPAWLGGRLGALLTSTALYGATFLLGVLLAEGVDWRGGLVLGFATYGSQMIVAWGVVMLSVWIVPTKKRSAQFSVREIWHLALAQQNGITAIVLALVLQPTIPIAIASVSLAIVVINLTQFGANWLFDMVIEPRVWSQSTEQPASASILGVEE